MVHDIDLALIHINVLLTTSLLGQSDVLHYGLEIIKFNCLFRILMYKTMLYNATQWYQF